jgi:hypothetical protein
MAKRHHHMDHKHAAVPHNSGHYEGPANRRHQEMEDAGMIRENHAAIANLPQEVMIKPWPAAGSYMPEELDDTIRGVNKQEALDDRLRDKHNVPKKV